jgi:hypothetical protein
VLHLDTLFHNQWIGREVIRMVQTMDVTPSEFPTYELISHVYVCVYVCVCVCVCVCARKCIVTGIRTVRDVDQL